MSAARFALRDYVPADAAGVVRFWVQAWNATGILPIDFALRGEWLAGHLAALAETGVHVIVAEVSGGPDDFPCPLPGRRGVCASRLCGLMTIDPRTGELDQLCVALGVQGTDLARHLLNEAKNRAPGRIELKVNVDNPRARRFYEREGFAVCERGISDISGLPFLGLRWAPKPKRGQALAGATLGRSASAPVSNCSRAKRA